MRRATSGCCNVMRRLSNWVNAAVVAAALLTPWPGSIEALAQSRVVEPSAVDMQLSTAMEPGELGPQWRSGSVPDNWVAVNPAGEAAAPSLWYRVTFEVPPGPKEVDSWALYLPYLYDGGRFWLNGQSLTTVAQTTAGTRLRWERPRLVTIPDSQLHSGSNELLLRSVRYGPRVGVQLQRIAIGPTVELLPKFDRRLFWVRTMPQYTVVTCLLVGLAVVFIWWRRRSEILYGLFGLAALLWGLRTLTFLIEVMPAAWWPWWRTLYHGATGGFIIVLALFVMRFAGVRWPRVEGAVLVYWLAGPLLMLASRGQLDSQVGLLWTAGLIPVGIGIVGFSAAAVARLRSGSSVALFVALVLGVAAGLHDYLVAWEGLVQVPDVVRTWVANRIFLLHHAANLLLLVMVSILTLRFVQTLDKLAEMNRNLEERISQREKELAARLAQMAQLEREQAVSDERQRIMQDLHDGLGSQMFTALVRVERGAVDAPDVAQMLRDCIADLRLTFELIAPDRFDFANALGNLRFRWDALFKEAGIASQWDFDGLQHAQSLGAAASLQVLRIAQESLTNVLKHARASRVSVTVSVENQLLSLVVHDNGLGIPAEATERTGTRGVSNMLHRARRLGAQLRVASEPGNTTVTLTLTIVDQRHDAARRALFLRS